MNNLKAWFIYRIFPIYLYFISVLILLPFFEHFYVTKIGYLIDTVVVLCISVGIINIFIFKIQREVRSFTRYEYFLKNRKEVIEDKYADKEIIAHYIEYEKVVRNGFNDFSKIMHKINLMNRNYKEARRSEKNKEKWSFRVLKINEKIVNNISFSFLIIMSALIISIPANYFYGNLPESLTLFALIFSVIYGIFYLYLEIDLIFTHRNEILNKKIYEEVRKNTENTYEGMYNRSNYSRLLLTMFEFSQTIETNLKLVNLDELSQEDFMFHVMKMEENKDEINKIFDEYLSLEKTKENVLMIQEKLKNITTFSTYLN